MRLHVAHFFSHGLEQMIVRFGSVPAEKDVAVIVDGCDFDSGLAQQFVRVASRGSPKWIEHHAQSGFPNSGEINDLSQTS